MSAPVTPAERVEPAEPGGGRGRRRAGRGAGGRAGRRAGRPFTFWLGLALFLAGLSVAVYLLYQLFGTNVVSHHRQQAAVEQLHRAWEEPNGPAEVQTGHGPAHAIIKIPAFGADYEQPLIEGTSEDALATGIGHYTGTAGPGGVGNFALAAHRITHGEPFAHLPDLVPGDTVVVETRDHTYTYVLDTGGEDLRVNFVDTWVLSRHPVNPDSGGTDPLPRARRLITLTTCAELFHTDDRYVVFGHLQSVTPS